MVHLLNNYSPDRTANIFSSNKSLLILSGVIVLLVATLLLELIRFDAKPGIKRKVVYSVFSSFKSVEILATLIPNPKLIDGYFLDDIEKHPQHRETRNWTNTYITEFHPEATKTDTGVVTSFHSDLLNLVANISSIDQNKKEVTVLIKGEPNILKITPYSYYYQIDDSIKNLDIETLTPKGRISNLNVLTPGKIASFLVFEENGTYKVIKAEI